MIRNEKFQEERFSLLVRNVSLFYVNSIHNQIEKNISSLVHYYIIVMFITVYTLPSYIQLAYYSVGRKIAEVILGALF